jgi:hypothetical protein
MHEEQPRTDQPTGTSHSETTVVDNATATISNQSASLAQSAPWPPAPRPRRKTPILQKIARVSAVVLACLLLLGGFALILYSTTTQYHSAVNDAANVSAQATHNALGTAQANQQGTANALSTAQAGINATATAQVGNVAAATQVSQNTTATALALSGSYANATNGQPAFDDPLTANTGPGKWDNGGNASQAACSFASGTYTINETQQDFLQPCIARATSFTDFTYQVSVTLVQGQQGQAGLLFRVAANNQDYYLFRIGADGSYALDVYQSNNQVRTLAQGSSSAITTGLNQSNMLAVIAHGSTYTLFANNQYITTSTDTTLSTGKIGVAAIDNQTPVTATFSDAQVWSKQQKNK